MTRWESRTHEFRSIVPDIAQQSTVLPRLHNQLPHELVSELNLLFAAISGQISIEADEVEVLKCFESVGVDEGAGVAVDEAGERDRGCRS